MSRWLRKKHALRKDGMTVVEGVRDDGAHIGIVIRGELREDSAWASLDGLSNIILSGKEQIDTDKFKGVAGWVEVPVT